MKSFDGTKQFIDRNEKIIKIVKGLRAVLFKGF